MFIKNISVRILTDIDIPVEYRSGIDAVTPATSDRFLALAESVPLTSNLRGDQTERELFACSWCNSMPKFASVRDCGKPVMPPCLGRRSGRRRGRLRPTSPKRELPTHESHPDKQGWPGRTAWTEWFGMVQPSRYFPLHRNADVNGLHGALRPIHYDVLSCRRRQILRDLGILVHLGTSTYILQ